MVDIYIYLTTLPDRVREMVTPCLDGYTVYIDERLSDDKRLIALNHAIQHIMSMDFQKDDIQKIELTAHE